MCGTRGLLQWTSFEGVSVPDSVNYPEFPAKAIYFKDVDKVNKGRYATCELYVNTDGTIHGHFKVENMQALAGVRIGGLLEFIDVDGNLIARKRMPTLGLKPVFFARSNQRHADFEGTIKPEHIAKLRRIHFKGFEDAVRDNSDDVEKGLDFFKDVKGLIFG